VDPSVRTFWKLFLLLLIQGLLSTIRAVVIRARWNSEDEPEKGRPEITRISAALDALILILAGSFFVSGVGDLTALIRPRLVPADTTPVTYLDPLLTAAILLILTWINLSLGHLGPEALSHTLPESWQERTLDFSRGLHWLLRPFSGSALTLGNAFSAWLGGKKLERESLITEEQIKTLVTAGEQEGIIEEEERAMIYSIFQLSDTLTREIMIPRIDIVAIDVRTPMPAVMATIVASGHSRFPVYAETIDNIIGVLYVKDLLQHYNTNTLPPLINQILRPAYFIPESKRLDDLLREMQLKKIQQAIVVDEYGGVAGLVTLEDIVEEIVGEIQDEYDREEPDAISLGEEGYLFDARIPLDDVQELLDIPMPLEEADSLGGFVYNQLGHIPTVGERLVFDQIEFQVVEIAGRRIRKVRALRIPELTEPAKEEEEPAPPQT